METVLGKEFIYKDGTKTTYKEILKAKVVLIYFSGVWCPPCTSSIPPRRQRIPAGDTQVLFRGEQGLHC